MYYGDGGVAQAPINGTIVLMPSHKTYSLQLIGVSSTVNTLTMGAILQ